MKNEGWRMKNEEWRMKNDEWRMKNEEWRMKDEVWGMSIEWEGYTGFCISPGSLEPPGGDLIVSLGLTEPCGGRVEDSCLQDYI